MRRTLSTIVLALGLVFSVASIGSADADTKPDTPLPAECQPTIDGLNGLLTNLYHVNSAQVDTINAQTAKIEKQHARILRLRERLNG